MVIHEFAHKLDMLNGRANGLPPLHADMSVREWSNVFNHAYEDFTRRIQHNSPIPINSYAATSPAELDGLANYEYHLTEALNQSEHLTRDGCHNLPILSFSPVAKQTWTSFFNRVET